MGKYCLRGNFNYSKFNQFVQDRRKNRCFYRFHYQWFLVSKSTATTPTKPKKENQHIFVKSNLKKRKVFIRDIKWIEALGDYVKLITINGSYVILSTMKAFENDLPTGKFLRIHKSYIINLKKIERYNSRFVEIDNFQIPLSRNKKQHLTNALESSS